MLYTDFSYMWTTSTRKRQGLPNSKFQSLSRSSNAHARACRGCSPSTITLTNGETSTDTCLTRQHFCGVHSTADHLLSTCYRQRHWHSPYGFTLLAPRPQPILSTSTAPQVPAAENVHILQTSTACSTYLAHAVAQDPGVPMSMGNSGV